MALTAELKEAGAACLLAAQAWLLAVYLSWNAALRVGSAWISLSIALFLKVALEVGKLLLLPAWLPLPHSWTGRAVAAAGRTAVAAAADAGNATARQAQPTTQTSDAPSSAFSSLSKPHDQLAQAPAAPFPAPSTRQPAGGPPASDSFQAAAASAGYVVVPADEGAAPQHADFQVEELEGPVGDEEDRIEAGYDRLMSTPLMSSAPTGTPDAMAAYMARQLSDAQLAQEQQPLLLKVPSSTSAAAADSAAGDAGEGHPAAAAAADESAAAAAAAFAEEAAEVAAEEAPPRPPSVENAEGVDELLMGGEVPSEGSAAQDFASSATAEAGPDAAALPPMLAEAPLPPMLREEALPPMLAEAALPPAELPPPLPLVPLPTEAEEGPYPAPGLSLAELLRTAPGTLEEEDEEALAQRVQQAQQLAAAAAALAPVSAAAAAGFTSGPSPLAIPSLAAVVAAEGGMPAVPAVPAVVFPEGLAEPMDLPVPPPQALPLDDAGSGGPASPSLGSPAPGSPSAAGLKAPALPGAPLVGAAAPGGLTVAPATPSIGTEGALSVPPPADRANTAFTNELAAAAHDLVMGS